MEFSRSAVQRACPGRGCAHRASPVGVGGGGADGCDDPVERRALEILQVGRRVVVQRAETDRDLHRVRQLRRQREEPGHLGAQRAMEVLARDLAVLLRRDAVDGDMDAIESGQHPADGVVVPPAECVADPRREREGAAAQGEILRHDALKERLGHHALGPRLDGVRAEDALGIADVDRLDDEHHRPQVRRVGQLYLPLGVRALQDLLGVGREGGPKRLRDRSAHRSTPMVTCGVMFTMPCHSWMLQLRVMAKRTESCW